MPCSPLSRLLLVILAGSSCVVAAQNEPLVFQENFATDPLAHGWRTFGDTSVFAWNPVNQDLAITWDSSQANSYFYHPLGRILTSDNDFTLAFDLSLADATIGGFGFEISVGLFNLATATNAAFLRGTGTDSPNLVEFAYFPDPGWLAFGSSVTVVMTDAVGTNLTDWSSGGYLPQDLSTDQTFRVVMAYTGVDRTLRTTLWQNGTLFATVPDAQVGADFLSFAVDSLAVESYNDANGWGSVLAHGTVGNIALTAAAPLGRISGGFDASAGWQATFLSHTNWVYTLERTGDFVQWAPATTDVAGTGGSLSLRDPGPAAPSAFYRVKAARP